MIRRTRLLQSTNEIIKYFKKYIIESDIVSKNINNLCDKDIKDIIIDESCDDSQYFHFLAFLYTCKFNDSEKAVKYYIISIEKGNSLALYNFCKFLDYDDSFKEKIKYYKMALEKGYDVLEKIIYYYYKNKKYYKIKKYLLKYKNKDLYFISEYYEDTQYCFI